MPAEGLAPCRTLFKHREDLVVNRLRISTLVALALLTGGAAHTEEASPKRWEAFALEDLRQQQEASSRPWLAFLKVPALSTGLYVLPAGGQDGQSPHERDEVYYVVAGLAVLEVDGERQPVRPGSVVYVKAEVDHRFVEIEEDLEVLVFFSAPPAGASSDE